ncbi:rhomboid-related protein 2-like [Haliotis rubra]|uniref:rhomboid-related protein 2-like n=1 Tax=Haliotis rubra TaxID=36100 RepID=UPI001EE6199C|nr:rhomboid-related protein 2-like [Haliotis rubra]
MYGDSDSIMPPSGRASTMSSSLFVFNTELTICGDTLGTQLLAQRWKPLFDQYDRGHHGEIDVEDFRRLLQHPQIQAEMDRHTLEVLEVKATDPTRKMISYQEFVNIMSNRRNPSFRLAVESREKDGWTSGRCLQVQPPPTTCYDKMVHKVAREFLTDELDRQYYADRYKCCPPPLLIPAITLIEIGCFIYYCLESGSIEPNGPVPVNSVFIYRPDRRLELWRFLFYTLLHAGYIHLFFNMAVQICVGIPLEMVHGSCRILIVYLAGVLAGSLGTSVFDMDAFLVGASGGVYALLAAHLANILLNYTHMELGILKLAAILIIASADVGFAIWDRYVHKEVVPPVGYVAHLMGALAGLTIGLVVLKNFEQKLHEQYVWWIALAVYLGCVVFAIFWNIFYY